MAVADEPKVEEGLKPSESPKETSVKTFTEEQVAEQVRKARSDVLADAGRYKAEAEKSSKAAQAALDRIAKYEAERIESELEQHKDDPAEIRRIRAEQKAKAAEDARTKVEQELAEHKERLSRIEAEKNESSLSQMVREVSAKTGVDPEKLLKYAKVTDGSLTAIEEVAKDLPKAKVPNSNLRPDNNHSTGGSLTDDQIVADFIKDPYNQQNRQRHAELRQRRGY